MALVLDIGAYKHTWESLEGSENSFSRDVCKVVTVVVVQMAAAVVVVVTVVVEIKAAVVTVTGTTAVVFAVPPSCSSVGERPPAVLG